MDFRSPDDNDKTFLRENHTIPALTDSRDKNQQNAPMGVQKCTMGVSAALVRYMSPCQMRDRAFAEIRVLRSRHPFRIGKC